MSNILQVYFNRKLSIDGKAEVNGYIEKAKARFTEDKFISTENRALMENCLEEW